MMWEKSHNYESQNWYPSHFQVDLKWGAACFFFSDWTEVQEDNLKLNFK